MRRLVHNMAFPDPLLFRQLQNNLGGAKSFIDCRQHTGFAKTRQCV